jgi:hypothetical protein
MKAIAVILFVLLAGCATKPDPYQMEYNAYRAELVQQFHAGNISYSEVLMFAQAKQNELLARKSLATSDRLGTMGLGVQLMQQSQPVFVPRY